MTRVPRIPFGSSATLADAVDRTDVCTAFSVVGAASTPASRLLAASGLALGPALGGVAAWAVALRALRDRAFSGRLQPVSRRDKGAAVGAGIAPARDKRGAVSLVGAGPGCADLITLRGVRRLQEADVIYFDRLVDPALLDLARPDASRVFVGKAPGLRAWPQARINRLLVASALAGKRVVRLKCGDPSVFGRAAEEIDALAEAGFAVEIVPGVTAASAAAAEVGRPLTDRNAGRTLVLASGHPAADAAPIDWSALARLDATLAIYMGVARAADTAQALIAGGADPCARVDIVERAGAFNSRRLSSPLHALADTIARESVRNPAILLVSPTAHPERRQRGARTCRAPASRLASVEFL